MQGKLASPAGSEIAALRHERNALARELAECRAEIQRRDAIELGVQRGLFETFSVRWKLQPGAPFIKLNDDLSVITSTIDTYTGWLGIKIDSQGWGSLSRPTCDVKTDAQHQQIMRDVFNHFSLLFEHTATSINFDQQADSLPKLCERVLNILSELGRIRGATLTTCTWAHLLRVLMGMADHLLRENKHNAGNMLASKLSPQLLRVLFELFLRSVEFTGPQGQLWDLLRELSSQWLHHSWLVDQWNAATLALTRSLVLSLYELPTEVNRSPALREFVLQWPPAAAVGTAAPTKSSEDATAPPWPGATEENKTRAKPKGRRTSTRERERYRHFDQSQPRADTSGAAQVELLWADRGGQRVAAHVRLRAELIAYAWHRTLHAVGNPNRLANPDLHLTAVNGLADLAEEFLLVGAVGFYGSDGGARGAPNTPKNRGKGGARDLAHAMMAGASLRKIKDKQQRTEDEKKKQRTLRLSFKKVDKQGGSNGNAVDVRAGAEAGGEGSGHATQAGNGRRRWLREPASGAPPPPSGNSILAILGPWLFEAALKDASGFERGRAAAIGVLCRIFCAHHCYHEPFLVPHVTRFYHVLARALVGEKMGGNVNTKQQKGSGNTGHGKNQTATSAHHGSGAYGAFSEPEHEVGSLMPAANDDSIAAVLAHAPKLLGCRFLPAVRAMLLPHLMPRVAMMLRWGVNNQAGQRTSIVPSFGHHHGKGMGGVEHNGSDGSKVGHSANHFPRPLAHGTNGAGSSSSPAGKTRKSQSDQKLEKLLGTSAMGDVPANREAYGAGGGLISVNEGRSGGTVGLGGYGGQEISQLKEGCVVMLGSVLLLPRHYFEVARRKRAYEQIYNAADIFSSTSSSHDSGGHHHESHGPPVSAVMSRLMGVGRGSSVKLLIDALRSEREPRATQMVVWLMVAAAEDEAAAWAADRTPLVAHSDLDIDDDEDSNSEDSEEEEEQQQEEKEEKWEGEE
jgi:hypothetical protein